MVVDGMGGHERGEAAAKIVVDRIVSFLENSSSMNEKTIQKAVQKANLAVKHFNKENNIKSGTAVGGLVIENDMAHIFWVGDVKIYQFKNDGLIYETQSHTLINSLIENQSIENPESRKKYRHILTHSVSGNPSDAQIGYHLTELNDSQFIICSDGVYDDMDVSKIKEMLEDGSLERYLSENASDNYSVIFVEF